MGARVGHRVGMRTGERAAPYFVDDTVYDGTVSTLQDLINLPVGHFAYVPGSNMDQVEKQPSEYGDWTGTKSETFNSYQGAPINLGLDPSRPGSAVEGVMANWCGGSYDRVNDRFYAFGGGHAKYGGNEVYEFSLATMRWARKSDPTIYPAEYALANFDSVKGTFQPASRHTYNGTCYIEWANKLLAFSGDGGFGTNGGCGITRAWTFDCSQLPADNVGWVEVDDAIAINPANDRDVWRPSNCGGQMVYDRLNGLVLYQNSGNRGGVSAQGWFSFDASAPPNVGAHPTAQWAALATGGDYGRMSSYSHTTFDHNRGLLVQIGNSNGVVTWDRNNWGSGRTTQPTSGETAMENVSAPGFLYDEYNDRLVSYIGGLDMYALNPDTWVWTKIPVAPTNIPTPPQSRKEELNMGGVGYVTLYSRWRYSPNYGVYIWPSMTGADVWFFKAHEPMLGYMDRWLPDIQDEQESYVLRNLNDAGADVTIVDSASAGQRATFESKDDYTAEGDGGQYHQITEGPPLWMAYEQSKRLQRREPAAAAHFATRAANEAAYWAACAIPGSEDDAFLAAGTGSCNYDHIYGWGLRDWYREQRDASAVAGLEHITRAMRTEAMDRGFYTGWTNWGDAPMRRYARWLLLGIACGEVSSDSDCIEFRDTMVENAMTSVLWDASAGIYYCSESRGNIKLDEAGIVERYADGWRSAGSFYTGICVEAFWQLYRVLKAGTVIGSWTAEEVRSRLIAMANWVYQWGRDPAIRSPNQSSPVTGSYIHLKNNTVLQHKAPTGNLTAYNVSLVNTLVFGYKLTGNVNYLTRAWEHYLDTQHDYRSGLSSARSTINFYADSLLGSNPVYMGVNKGVLQYSYGLFENGGNPRIMI